MGVSLILCSGKRAVRCCNIMHNLEIRTTYDSSVLRLHCHAKVILAVPPWHRSTSGSLQSQPRSNLSENFELMA